MQLIQKTLRKRSEIQLLKRSLYKKTTVQVDDVINNFRVIRKENLETVNLELVELEHEQLKTKIIQIINEDDLNNCLSFNFKTLPQNDKGVPHILEHLATCGSTKYQIRDPFMKMVKRSLNTFMNALTGPDFTSYPFSSANEKDFENLLKIYMDISYRPLLRINDFRQEGWRLVSNPDKSLGMNGVVLNEMKGVVQDMSGVYYEAILNNIHTDNCYTFQSGGHPSSIYQLSYEELLQFHQEHYHPSNSVIYLYGSYPIETLTHTLHHQYLKDYTAQNRMTVSPTQPWTAHKEVTVTSQYDKSAMNPEKQAKYSLTWLCSDLVSTCPEEQVGLQILAHILLHTPTSPFYQSLIESHLSPAFSPGTGFDKQSTRQGFLSIGVSDIEESVSSFQQIEQVILDTLKDIQEKGLDKELVQGCLHQYRVDTRQQKANVGIRHLMGLFQYINQDADVKAYFDSAKYIDNIVEKTSQGIPVFEQLIHKYLTNNPHVLKLAMVARQDHFQQSEAKEAAFLKQQEQQMTTENKQEMERLNQSLEDEQNQRDTEEEQRLLSQLPTLHTSDINRLRQITTSTLTSIQEVPLEYLDMNTNGMTYFRLKYSLDNLSDMHKQYIRILCETLPRVGSADHSYQQMSQQLSLFSTDLSFSYSCHLPANQPSGQPQHQLTLSIACLDTHIPQMMTLLSSLLSTPAFSDKDNLYNLIQQLNTSNLSSLTEDSMSIAQQVVTANAQPALRSVNHLKDIQYLHTLCQSITTNGQVNVYMEDMAWHLEQVMRHITQRARLQAIVHTSAANQSVFNHSFNQLLDSLSTNYINFERKGNAFINIDKPQQLINQKQFYKLPLQVNYCMQALPIIHYTHPDSPLLQVFSRIASNTLLHREIREKGGAYGSGMRVDPLNSVASLFSYRDPQTLRTYQKYNESLQQIAQGDFNQDDIKEAKLTIFQRLDAPTVNHNKGLSMFTSGVSQEMLQNSRDIILDATKEQITLAAQNHIMRQMESNNTAQVIFGTEKQESIDELKSNDWEIINIFDVNKNE